MRLCFLPVINIDYFRRSTNSASVQSGTTFSTIQQHNKLQNNAQQAQNVQCKEVRHGVKTSLGCFMATVIALQKPKVNRFLQNNFRKSKILHFAGISIKYTQILSELVVIETEIVSVLLLSG